MREKGPLFVPAGLAGGGGGAGHSGAEDLAFLLSLLCDEQRGGPQACDGGTGLPSGFSQLIWEPWENNGDPFPVTFPHPHLKFHRVCL